MKGILFEALADYYAELFNRTVFEPIYINRNWLPVNNNWHSLISGTDMGIAGPAQMQLNGDLFFGQIKVINSTDATERFKPCKIVLPRFATCNNVGLVFNLARNVAYFEGKHCFEGLFAAMYTTLVPTYAYYIEYNGYLLKVN